MNEHKDFYSPEQVATLLDLHVRTVRRFIREGKLKATRIGKQYRVNTRDLSEFVGSDNTGHTFNAVNRQRHVIVSTTVDIDAIGKEETYRISTSLTGAFNSAREKGSGKRLECIYYEEQGRLRIVINADLESTHAILGLISVVLNDGRVT